MAFSVHSPCLSPTLLIWPVSCYVTVEVDPEVFEAVRALHILSIERDCWHRLFCSFAVERCKTEVVSYLDRFPTLSLGTIVTLFQLFLEEKPLATAAQALWAVS